MKAKITITIFSILFFTGGTAFCVGVGLDINRPVIGIGLDPEPLPELLVKHLNLEAGQGIRISNIMTGSAADKAELERDDIIVSFQGQDLFGGQELNQAVQEAGVDAQVSLEVIHLGQRKTVDLTLKAQSETSGWKYPDETPGLPQIEQFYRPGRILRFGPDDQNWMQVQKDQLPFKLRTNINSLFNEFYSFHYITDDKQYDFTIEGSPDDEDSKITINIDGNKYETTLKDIDKLPEEHREIARQAIEKAREREWTNIKITPRLPDYFGNSIIPQLRTDSPLLNRPDSFDITFFDRIEEQMRQMQERMRELEKSQNSFLDSLTEKEKGN